jgi:hypothetical protein
MTGARAERVGQLQDRSAWVMKRELRKSKQREHVCVVRVPLMHFDQQFLSESRVVGGNLIRFQKARGLQERRSIVIPPHILNTRISHGF